jgi:hypothetical protein
MISYMTSSAGKAKGHIHYSYVEQLSGINVKSNDKTLMYIMNIHGEACRVEQSIPGTVLASIVLVGIGSSELCDSDPQCCLS